ncbi:MAG: hypothetical protein LC640_09445 [Frankia sp.]|nr:hypothetical protein [Frankia sp.]
MSAVLRTHEVTVRRTTYYVGDRCRIRGHRGVFRFLCLATNAAGVQWIEVDGPEGKPRPRAFRVDDLTAKLPGARARRPHARLPRRGAPPVVMDLSGASS